MAEYIRLRQPDQIGILAEPFLCYTVRQMQAKGLRGMKLKKEALLPSGETIMLRSLAAADAQAALALCRKTAGETMNMMFYPDEWTVTLEREIEMIIGAQNEPKALMMGAFVDRRLVGLCSLRSVHPADRARHRAGFGISILRAFWGRGIGTAMLQTAIDAAKTTALEQIELDVLSTNESAIRLYRRFGFEEFGRRPRMMKYRDGRYADGVLMMLDLRKKQ